MIVEGIEMRVITKAYGDAPLEREVIGQTNGLVYVANPSTNVSTETGERVGVGFPRQYVFRFEPQLFESLNEAWERRDLAQLESLWGRAERLP
jgi:hypothetical protein